MDINLHHLRYFAAIVREGSIASAARALGVSAPTISAQLRELEQRLGQPLFDRVGRGLVLTEAGRVAASHAEQLAVLSSQLMDSLRQGAVAARLRFKVGVSSGLPKLSSYRLLEPALRLPEFGRLELRVDQTERLLGSLAAHDLDLVLDDQPVPATARIRAYNHLLGESGVTVFAPPSVARKFRRDFPRSLQGAPFLLPGPQAPLRRTLEQWFSRHHVQPVIKAEVEDLGMLQVLGQHGFGLFAAPSVVEDEIRRSYSVQAIGRLAGAVHSFYAITVERRLHHPAALAIQASARLTFQ